MISWQEDDLPVFTPDATESLSDGLRARFPVAYAELGARRERPPWPLLGLLVASLAVVAWWGVLS